jgi:short subunit dehydrogenase-like uncharacterized protein
MLFDPYVLDLRDDARGRTDAGGGRWRPAYEPRVGRWVAPFVMGAMNVPVVHRSNALQGDAYGRGFRYREVMRMPRGPVGAVAAAALTGGLGVAVGALALRPTRALLDRALPSPGEGPSEKTRSAGYFRIEIHTTTSAGAHYVSRVAATGDPGYAATSVMFGETALALALDGADLPDRAGVLTPATGLGMHLVRRLRRQGMTFEAGPA